MAMSSSVPPNSTTPSPRSRPPSDQIRAGLRHASDPRPDRRRRADRPLSPRRPRRLRRRPASRPASSIPFATKQFRQPADPGNKTDDTDLSAIHRAAVNGFGLVEPAPDPTHNDLKLLARHRRDLVRKAVALRCKIREHLNVFMPGFERCFADPFDGDVALTFARRLGSPRAVREAGVAGLERILRDAGVGFQKRTLDRVVAWAERAPDPSDDAPIHQRIAIALEDDRRAKLREIATLESDLAELLARTPYLLLLSIPGINVVSAAEFAGEMGPIGHYASSRSITRRAGLVPSRYQSDQVDRKDGPLVRQANRSLRQAILTIADNLMSCNDYFRGPVGAVARGGQGPETFSREGRGAVLPDRVPDGGGRPGVQAPVLSASGLHFEQVDQVS